MMPKLVCISLTDRKEIALPPESVVCLGNFDGVHLAHRALMRETKELQQRRFPAAACAVFCFEPSSRAFFSPNQAIQLSDIGQKLNCFAEMGMDYAFLADFPSMKDLSPKAFVEEILIDICHCKAAVCGFNFRFGKNADGSPTELAAYLSGEVVVQPEICLPDGQRVSSSAIRTALENGDVVLANTMLTRPYSLTAEVIHGKSLGKKLGTPTVNQCFPDQMLIPRHGVYLTDCEIDSRLIRGISNVGIRPTVEESRQANCETHLLDFDEDLYGKTVTVHFLKFLRPERAFEGIEDLRRQIAADIASARHDSGVFSDSKQ